MYISDTSELLAGVIEDFKPKSGFAKGITDNWIEKMVEFCETGQGKCSTIRPGQKLIGGETL
ncbi:MAG: hypothetical protein ACRCT6_04135, partial [Notoacmeibacter sp.]